LTNPPDRQRGWRDVATLIALAGVLVALAGLVITMVFNTISVQQGVEQARDQAKQARQTSLHTEIGMLTSLSAYLQQTDVALTLTRAERHLQNPRVPLSAREKAKVLTQLQSYDYLAWLFNQRDVWKLSAARRYWKRRMLHAFKIATGVYDLSAVAKHFPELVHFVRVTTR
jgi:hypothetical protein